MIGRLFAVGIWLLFLYAVVVKDGEIADGVVRYRWYRLLWFFLLPLALILGAAAWVSLDEPGRGVALGFAAAALPASVVLFPDFVVRRVFRPLGWTRGAYGLSLLANRTWHLAPKTGAECAALQVHPPSSSTSADRSWLERRRPIEGPVVGIHVLAEALRAYRRGETDRTRILMETILYLPPRARVGRDAQLAEEWLMLHSAERGAWDELAALTPSSRAQRRFRRFLMACGDALSSRASAPGPARLTWWWLVSGRPRASYHLWRRALEASRLPDVEVEDGGELAGADADADADRSSELQGAFAATLAAHGGTGSLEAAGDAWLRALDGDELQGWLRGRCGQLDLDPETARESLEASVTEAMAQLAESSGSGATLPAAFAGRLDNRFEEVMARLDASLDGLDDPAPDDVYGELDRWCEIRRCWHEALLLGTSRLSLYHQVLAPLWNWASELHGERGQRPLAQAIFAWLYQWTVELGDEDDAYILLRNAQLSV